MNQLFRLKPLVLVIASLGFSFASAEDKTLDTFRAQQISDFYYSEGAAAGDLNNDGKVDFVYGPHWYEGPSFEVKHEIYPAKPQNREGYTDHFFAWVHDFDADGWKDVLTVGFPGTPAFVYQNPGTSNSKGPWEKHQVFDWVSNESPQFVQLVGDDRPELVCSRDGFFGYAAIDWSRPFEPWKFVAISAQVTDKKFGHGLGIGDVDGDGLLWPAQSAVADAGPHPVPRGLRGGHSEAVDAQHRRAGGEAAHERRISTPIRR